MISFDPAISLSGIHPTKTKTSIYVYVNKMWQKKIQEQSICHLK